MAANTDVADALHLLLRSRAGLGLAHELDRSPTDEDIGPAVRVVSNAVVGMGALGAIENQRHLRLALQSHTGERLC